MVITTHFYHGKITMTKVVSQMLPNNNFVLPELSIPFFGKFSYFKSKHHNFSLLNQSEKKSGEKKK